MSRELLQQALDALDAIAYNDDNGKCNACGHDYGGHVYGAHYPGCKVNAACDALRAALAALQQEPVALCDALRWSGAKESHGAIVFSPEQLRKFYEFASAPPAAPAPADQTTSMDYGMFVDERTNPPAPAVPTISPLALRALRMADMPVAYVPRCHTDGNYCIVGEYKWDEIEEKPFGLADPAHWECAALYAAPPAAPAPAVPLTDDIVEKEFVSRGDGRSQGLHPYWKSAFREGWHFARAMIAASPPAPAVAEPLSDERIDEIFEGAHENMPKGVLFRTFIARAIEQAHGIGGGGNG